MERTMTKKATLPKNKRNAAKARQQKIAVSIAKLEAIKPRSAKAAEALADESAYDEAVWPKLKKALNRERELVGARRLFDD
jgi:hypothetical protein